MIQTDDTEVEYSAKIDHDDIPVSHGNASINQGGNLLKLIFDVKNQFR